MPDAVIRLENLGKKYVLGHQQDGNKSKTLRDAIAHGAKSLGKKLVTSSGQKKLNQTHA